MSDSTVELRLALQARRAAELGRRVERLLAPLRGDERALDAGCGTGAFAVAVAPLVATVVGVDPAERFVEAARAAAPDGATFVVGDATALPFADDSFDLAGCLRVLHHVARPDRVVAEIARVVRPGGRVLLVDQLGSADPQRGAELDRFERARDATHARLLPDAELRRLLAASGLAVVADEVVSEERDVEAFLDLAGLEGERRAQVRRLAPAPRYAVELGWYVARVEPALA